MSGWPMADVVLTSHQNVTNSAKEPSINQSQRQILEIFQEYLFFKKKYI